MIFPGKTEPETHHVGLGSSRGQPRGQRAAQPRSKLRGCFLPLPFPTGGDPFLPPLPARSVTPTGIYEHLERGGYDLGTRRERLAGAPGFPAEITRRLAGGWARKSPGSARGGTAPGHLRKGQERLRWRPASPRRSPCAFGGSVKGSPGLSPGGGGDWNYIDCPDGVNAGSQLQPRRARTSGYHLPSLRTSHPAEGSGGVRPVDVAPSPRRVPGTSQPIAPP